MTTSLQLSFRNQDWHDDRLSLNVIRIDWDGNSDVSKSMPTIMSAVWITLIDYIYIYKETVIYNYQILIIISCLLFLISTQSTNNKCMIADPHVWRLNLEQNYDSRSLCLHTESITNEYSVFSSHLWLCKPKYTSFVFNSCFSFLPSICTTIMIGVHWFMQQSVRYDDQLY